MPPDAAVDLVLGRLLPVVIVFGLLILLTGLLFQGAGWFALLRRANREFAPAADGARFALSRLPALAGWSLAGGVLLAVAAGLPLVPGMLSESGPVVLAGAAVSALAGLVIGSGVFSVLPGVVLIERAGLGRAMALIRSRWLALWMRMLIVSVGYVVYGLLSGLLVAGVAGWTGFGLISSLLQGVTVIPVLVFQLVVAVVTYAELRGRADGTSTGALAAELVGRGSSACTVGDETPSAATRRARRWRGLRWVTPVLVLSMLVATTSLSRVSTPTTSATTPSSSTTPPAHSPPEVVEALHTDRTSWRIPMERSSRFRQERPAHLPRTMAQDSSTRAGAVVTDLTHELRASASWTLTTILRIHSQTAT